MKFLQYLFFITSFCLISTICTAQHYTTINNFTTAQGLPSNHIYEAVQDSLGFLWLATDNGVSRFDGKQFINFDVKDGLTSNDVIQIKITADGTLWTNCYRHIPTYFDYKTNRFVTPPYTEKVKQICNGYLQAIDWSNNFMQFITSVGSIIANKKEIKIIESGRSVTPLFGIKNQRLSISSYTNKSLDKVAQFFLFHDTDTTKLGYYHSAISLKSNNKFYLFSKNELIRFTIQSIKNVNKKVIKTPAEKRSANIIDSFLIAVFTNNCIQLYNNNTMKLEEQIDGVANPLSAYIDKNRKIWVCTADEGLLTYSTNNLTKINLPKQFKQDKILTAAYTAKGIVTGISSGYVLAYNNNVVTKHLVLDKVNALWNHKFFPIGNNIITLMNRYYKINFGSNKTISANNNINTQLKCGAVINDSIIYIGAYNGGTVLNINTLKHKTLDKIGYKVFAACKRSYNSVYFIKEDGLFKSNLNLSVTTPIKSNSYLQNESPDLVSALDSNWCAITTNFNNLIILKKEKTVLKIFQEEGLFEGIKKIQFYKNKILLACKTGLAIVTLDTSNSKIKYSIQYISKADGLPNNDVNDFDIKNNILLIATNNGLVQLPINIVDTTTTIIPALTNLVANNKSLPIQTSYTLMPNQRNISLSLSGVDITGHCKHLLYAINDTTNWQKLESNILNLQLDYNNTNMYLKSVNTNGQVSKQTALIQFYIKKPFYQTNLFIILSSLLMLSGLFYYFYQQKFREQKSNFEKQTALDNQQKNITADLHDDIGATLSSLQLNSNIARKMIDSNLNKTSSLLTTIEQQAKELSEKVGDIIWSMKGEEAFGGFSDRIKTYANQILDASPIEYTIQIDDAIDNYIVDAVTKKNLLFITKEAINNTVKYSNAKMVNIICNIQYQQIYLCIVDNGKGFDIKNTHGNGLQNMQKRVKELAGKIKVTSEINKGTTIEINIPTNIRGK